MMLRRFTVDEIATIKRMAATGHSGISIARQLDRPALAIRKKCVELGVSLRPVRIETKRRIVVAGDVLTLLRSAAQARGVSAQRLASMILSAVAIDNLTNAVIDDQSARNKARAKKRKAPAGKTIAPPPKPLDIALIRGEVEPLFASVQAPVCGSTDLQANSAREA